MTQSTTTYAEGPPTVPMLPPSRVLVVDDEPAIRQLLVRILANEGLEPEVAATGREALNALEATAFDLMLLDLNMPAMTGLELLRSKGTLGQETGVVVMTGSGDIGTAVEAMQLGALDYILKPFDANRLVAAVYSAQARMARRTREYQRDVESVLGPQSELLARVEGELAKNSERALEALVAALDARERETQHHSKRVSEYATYLASALGIDERQIRVIRRAGVLHDIGKIGVPDRILLKRGPLTRSEWIKMKGHPEIGFGILRTLPSLEGESELVLTHHERFDGDGYPNKLKGTQIPLGARIFSVVDSFDAMTSDRPYRCAITFEAALREMVRCAGSQFDPEVVRAFRRISLETWASIRAQTMKRGAGSIARSPFRQSMPA